jgi:SAM-dependent methyltransferase
VTVVPEKLDDIYAANQRVWDERVAVHLAPGGYDLAPLRAGAGRLDPITEAELPGVVGDLAGQRVIHLQCHIGTDSLTIAQRGAEVVGVDFSAAAVAAATGLAGELGLGDRARFVECGLYDAPEAVGEAAAFDLVFVTWGAIYWLPDIRGWAKVVAHFLRPGGRLYLAEGHPSALVFDDVAPGQDDKPGWFAPYFEAGPLVFDDATDYADPEAVLSHTRNYAWMHPLGATVSALIEAGLSLRFLNEHDAVTWRMFRTLERRPDGLYAWPDRPWLPLAFSLAAEKV